LGDSTDRENSNIDEPILTQWLIKRGYMNAQINVALHKLRTEADNHNRNLYGNNQAVYSLLRYGVPVKIEAGKVTETVQLIDWNKLDANDFAVAKEVTLKGNYERRPESCCMSTASRWACWNLRIVAQALAMASARSCPI